MVELEEVCRGAERGDRGQRSRTESRETGQETRRVNHVVGVRENILEPVEDAGKNEGGGDGTRMEGAIDARVDDEDDAVPIAERGDLQLLLVEGLEGL